MEEEVIEICQPNISDRDGLLLFDTTVLESLNKLTDEIQEGLLTDRDSDAASDSYDSDEYTDDDEDPDSGENKLFNMMDDLVMELQQELHNCDQFMLIEANAEKNDAVNDNNTADADEEVVNGTTIFEPTPQNENLFTVSTDEQEKEDYHPTFSTCASMRPPELDNKRSLDRTNASFPENEGAEKQRRLHTQVKKLLHHVSMLTELAESEEKPEDEVTVGLAAGDRRKRGDSSADKFEELLGALSSYSTSTEEEPAPADDEAAAVAPTTFVSEEQAKTARAMSGYTRRRRRQYLLRKQLAASNEECVGGRRDAPATVTPPSNKESAKKKKSRPRTNKHKKGKHKNSTPDSSELRYQHLRNTQQMQWQQKSFHAQQPEPIPRQSLRALLSQLLALEERLARGPMM
jgi:hypothetical protein